LESELIKLNVIPDNIFSFLQQTNNFLGRICVQSDRNISPESLLGSTSERNTSNEIMVGMGEPSYNFTIKDNAKVMQSANNVKKEPLEKKDSN
jgi:adenine C2-methylase RlmN of 23S rRNA A2503 and tRNA A37